MSIMISLLLTIRIVVMNIDHLDAFCLHRFLADGWWSFLWLHLKRWFLTKILIQPAISHIIWNFIPIRIIVMIIVKIKLTTWGRVVSLGWLLPALFSASTRNSYLVPGIGFFLVFCCRQHNFQHQHHHCHHDLPVVSWSTVPVLFFAGFTCNQHHHRHQHHQHHHFHHPRLSTLYHCHHHLTLGPSCHPSSFLWKRMKLYP